MQKGEREREKFEIFGTLIILLLPIFCNQILFPSSQNGIYGLIPLGAFLECLALKLISKLA
ncbi:hypothetical protein H5410_023618 [Solanum commersonii]|uniref:Uncharacterized protein n=1 Tax=Solanum commersonii TaxID=4109 RepID=A0A9J5ZHC7_SOLCO|nr:hypothetical protein H5410_023618 [Solanum commersonii]